jgi:hypothetical protein
MFFQSSFYLQSLFICRVNPEKTGLPETMGHPDPVVTLEKKVHKVQLAHLALLGHQVKEEHRDHLDREASKGCLELLETQELLERTESLDYKEQLVFLGPQE